MIRRSFSDASLPDHRADVGTLIRAIMNPYEGDSAHPARVEISGPEVSIGEHATNGVALVLHELATNAAKYGALSRDIGSVRIDWSTDETALTLTWKERGGPLVTGAPLAVGFGSRLVRETVMRNLGGTQRYEWQPGGVKVTLRLPLDLLKS